MLMYYMHTALLDDTVIERLGGWAAPRGGRPSPVRLLNLDKRALLDRLKSDQPAERRLTVRWFAGAGVCQIGWGTYKHEQHQARPKKTTPDRAKMNAIQSAKRAATEVRRSLLSICADRMLTLTYAENMTDRTRAIQHLMKFIRIMRRKCSRWQSVAVLEYQKRGACHFHIGLGGFYDISEIRAAWESIVGRGAVNMAFEPRGQGNACSKLASYMAKYLAKDLDEGRKAGEHRYFKTEQSEDGRKQTYFIPASAPIGIERELSVDIMKQLICPDGGFPSNLWFGPEGMGSSGYASAEVSCR